MLKDVDLSVLELELAQDGEVMKPLDAEADLWAIRGIQPSLVVAPSTSEGLASALARCDRARAAVIPWGGGTQQKLGLPPRRADVVLVTRQLNRVIEYEPGDLTVTAEAGIRLSDLQAALGANGQWLPIDPPVAPDATLGGIVATNVSGPRRLKEGGLRDLVIGTRVANVNGTITRAGGRVVKNVTGYDLNKAHIGGLGTLGVLVELSLKIAPRPQMERSWLGIFPAAAAAGKAVDRLLQLPITPTGLETLNARLAGQLGLPVRPGQWVLIGRASGFGPAVERHLAEFEAAAQSAEAIGTQILGDDEAGGFWAKYGETAANLRWAADALTCRFALPRASVGSLCDRISELAGEPLIWAHATGTVFWSVPEQAVKEARIVPVLRALAAASGGGVVAENWPTEAEGLDVWGVPGGPLSIMRAIKNQYDPNGTLNPGRFVGGI